ncbi:MAG: hypothetical protein RMN25_03150 [Anaerolineae bacterium]|nr:hypothetical protein [Thermoflexales bacterium]MDW8406755.1 hypothetical protein [Anaerolineae bacterium]
MTPVQATQPPRTNRTGCVLGVVLAVIVLCCVVLLIAGVMLFNLGDFDGESWLGFELTPTAVARTPPPRSPSDSGGLALEEALGGSGGPTPTGQPAPALPATADDFVGVWEVIAAQDADGSPRDDLVGGQIRLLLADDGETILGVQPPDKEPTEADLSLQVSEGRTAVGEIINSDPKVVVTVVLSEDGQELELTMSTSSQEVLLVLKRIEDGAGQ